MEDSTSEDESRRPRRPSALERDASGDAQLPSSGTDAEPLVGRRRELETLEHALHELRTGSCRVLEVVGEPGIGKTRLLAELAVRAARWGLPHLRGRATEFEREMPFGVVTQAIDNHLAALDPGWLQEIGAGWIDLLDQVFPSLSARAGRGRGGPTALFDLLEVERHRLYHAVRILVEELAVPGGLVLVLDDMHWADQATVELLAYFLRHPPRAPVLLVLAYRPRQVSVRLAAGLTEATRDGLAERIELGPLTIEEAGELLGSRVSRSRCQALYEPSGGNPFYLEALARTTRGAEGDPGAGESIGDVPRSVAVALLAELDVLSAPARLMSQAAAVAGDPFEPELAAKVAGLEQPEGLAALDELIARDLVRPSSLRGFRYRHPLVRSVAYEAAAAGWRLAAHARAAAVLEAQGASVTIRAHHVARAADVGDEAAISVLEQAAQETMARAPATAVHWLQAAIRLAGAEEASPRRLELLLRLANALFTAGRLHACLNVLHEVLRLVPPEMADARTQAAVLCAMAEGQLGRHAQARALLLDELAALEERDTPQATSLKLELATRSLSSGDVDASRAWAGEALEAAKCSRNRSLQAAASGVLAMASCTTGAIDVATACTDETAALVDGLPDAEFVHRLDTFVSLGWSERYLDRHDDALRHLTRGLAVARATGQGWVVPHLLVALSRVLGLLGHLTEAAGYADDGVETALLVGSDELQTMALNDAVLDRHAGRGPRRGPAGWAAGGGCDWRRQRPVVRPGAGDGGRRAPCRRRCPGLRRGGARGGRGPRLGGHRRLDPGQPLRDAGRGGARPGPACCGGSMGRSSGCHRRPPRAHRLDGLRAACPGQAARVERRRQRCGACPSRDPSVALWGSGMPVRRACGR
jgi:AAA ATPase-like protein